MNIRLARFEDAPAMARVIVDTFMFVNQDQGLMSEEALQKRREEWTYEVSTRNWEDGLREIAEGAKPRSCIYVAVDNLDGVDEVVGLADGCPSKSAENIGEIGEIDVLYVRTSHQGQGIGRSLVQAVATHLAQIGMTGLHIAALEASAPARRFYEALGGRVIGTREGYDDGVMYPLVVYGWEDTHDLIATSNSAIESGS